MPYSAYPWQNLPAGGTPIDAANLNRMEAGIALGVSTAEGLATTKADLASPGFTGVPTAPTAALGTNTSQLATMAAIQGAIAALINSAPGALDTLEELADALGDDANFAATMTSALALKAPLASPVFTGNPTGPTPAPGDNDTSLATTAFVQAALAAGVSTVGWRYQQVLGGYGNAQTQDVFSVNVSQGALHITTVAIALAYIGVAHFIVPLAYTGTAAWLIVRPYASNHGDHTRLEVNVDAGLTKIRIRNAAGGNLDTTTVTALSLSDTTPTWTALAANVSAVSTTALFGFERTRLAALEQAGAAAGDSMRWDDTNKLWIPSAVAIADVTGLTSALAAKAPLVSPALTGSPTAPTQAALDNSAKIATTAYVEAAVTAGPGGGGGGSGAEVLIQQIIVGTDVTAPAASVSFSGIVSTYRDLRLVVRGRGDNAATNVNVRVQFNGDSAANYDYETLGAAGATAFGAAVVGATFIETGWMSSAGAPTGVASTVDMLIANYKNTVFHKDATAKTNLKQANSGGSLLSGLFASWWRSTSAINAVLVFPSAGNFVSGTVISLYGRS